MSIAIAYAEECVEDKRGKWSCRLLRLAARRFLRDLERALSRKPPFLFSPQHANWYCHFIEQLPHVEGQWASPTIVLDPFQIFFLVNLFGFRKLTGGRRFEEALFCVARKNAKSTLSAAILAACMCLDSEPGPQLITAATTGQQAGIIYRTAREMFEKAPGTRQRFGVRTFARAITREGSGGTIRAINAKASTQDGLNPYVTAFDEIHAHKTHDLINVLRSAAGGRSNPLWLYTTTEGYENPGPWGEMRTYAKQILERKRSADHFLALIFCLDPDDDALDERKWVKANPLGHSNPNIYAQMRQLAINARAMPSSLAEFEIKRCNRRAATASGLIRLGKWRACAGPVPLEELAASGCPCWGSFDLASTLDMNAWRLLWLWEGKFYTWGRFWVPEAQIALRTADGMFRYEGWKKSGALQVTPGETTDYDYIARDILADCARFSPQKIAYDAWNATQLANRLIDEGLELEVFIQGPRSYNPAIKLCEETYIAGNLSHGGDPVLLWNAANLVPRYDINLNMAPDRKHSADKIDGMCALLMCFGLAAVAGDDSNWQEFLANPIKVSA